MYSSTIKPLFIFVTSVLSHVLHRYYNTCYACYTTTRMPAYAIGEPAYASLESPPVHHWRGNNTRHYFFSNNALEGILYYFTTSRI